MDTDDGPIGDHSPKIHHTTGTSSPLTDVLDLKDSDDDDGCDD
jgi:hypothetical protein